MGACLRYAFADILPRAQPLRRVYARSLFYGVAYGAAISEQKPVFRQITAFHSNKGVRHLGGVVAPMQVASHETHGEKGRIANSEVGSHVFTEWRGVGRGGKSRTQEPGRVLPGARALDTGERPQGL